MKTPAATARRVRQASVASVRSKSEQNVFWPCVIASRNGAEKITSSGARPHVRQSLDRIANRHSRVIAVANAARLIPSQVSIAGRNGIADSGANGIA